MNVDDFPSGYELYVEILSMEGFDPFVTGIRGQATVEQLQEIEVDCFENSVDMFTKGDGSYLFKATYEPAQIGDYGRIENDDYWDLSLIKYRGLEAS